MALISIVVPVYNAGAYIGQTMDMVLGQTFTDWELLLVDDGSTDDSVQVMEEKRASCPEPDRIRILLQGKNLRAAAARNRGIREARGRYIAFLDADDIWYPEKLEKELAFIREKDAAFVCHAYAFGDEEARPTGRIVHVESEMTWRKALTRTTIFTTTVMFDMEKLSREEVEFPACVSEDTALWWSLLRKGYICYGLNEVLAIYRRPATSLSSDKVEAVRRIWYLYREREHLSIPASALCFVGWACRATLRRL